MFDFFDFFGKKKIAELSQLLLKMEQDSDEREQRALRRQKTIHIEALMNFAENFALSCRNKDDDESIILLAKTEDILSDFGLMMINDIMTEFDHDIHEACMTRCDLDFEDGDVIEIIRPGFVLDGELLRHAVVVVNKIEEENE